jgi:Tfp pilus assembly protein PilF
MGDLFLSERKYSQAATYLRKAIALDPKEYLYQQNLGDAYLHLGFVREAGQAYRRAMELGLGLLERDPRAAFVRSMVGYNAARLGERQRAKDETKQALQLDPDNNRIIFRAILTYEILEMRQDAVALSTIAPPQILAELRKVVDMNNLIDDARFKSIDSKNH